MGWTFPLPDDDSWSCDGTEESDRGTPFGTNTSFAHDHLEEDAPTPHKWPNLDDSAWPNLGTGEGFFSLSTQGPVLLHTPISTRWDCRAASGSGWMQSHNDSLSVGDNTPDILNKPAHLAETKTTSGTVVAGEQQHLFEFSQPQTSSTAQPPHAGSTTHGKCLKITGGAPDYPCTSSGTEEPNAAMSMQY